MSKITPYEANAVLEAYKQMERKCPKLNNAEVGYVPSRVIEILQDPARPNYTTYVRVVKQCMDDRGHPFEYTFRKLHAVFFMLAHMGETMDRAKKRYRLLLDKARSEATSLDKTHFLDFVKEEHVRLFKES